MVQSSLKPYIDEYPGDAISQLQQAIDQTPHVARHHFQLAKLLKQNNRFDEAIDHLRQAIRLRPDYAAAHNNLASLLLQKRELDSAAAHLQQALQHRPDLLESHCNLATIDLLRGEFAAAETRLRWILQLKPDHLPSLNTLGNLLKNRGFFDQAIHTFQQLLTLKSDNAPAHFMLAQIYELKGEFDQALFHYQQVRALKPEDELMAVFLEILRFKRCDWQDYEQRIQFLNQAIEKALNANSPDLDINPFALNVLPVEPSLYLKVAQAFASRISASQPPLIHRRTLPAVAKPLRIGYLSPDFRDHPVGRLVREMFAYHDRQQFEVYAYFLTNKQDAVGQQIKAECDVAIDLSNVSAQVAAQRIADDGIHILIDLAGYTLYSRPEILALQPAPIQMQWLGYPNTMGAEFVQYLLADPWLVPPELAKDYSEEIIYLPHAFVASSMTSAAEPLSRTALGLPEDCFVFCCFNNTDKISPQVFATWMRILQQVSHSVLWLGNCPEAVQLNLRQSAQDNGIDPKRLYFATYLSESQYLARYRLVDLFLDTTLYSAGSTGVAALWMGVPLLTCPGNTNASRMGASLCAATNLEPLICSNLAEYERKAVHFATHPEELQALRQHLIEQRQTLPLFNLQGFVSHLEAALQQIWQRHNSHQETTISTIPSSPSPLPLPSIAPSSARSSLPGSTDPRSPAMLTTSRQFPEWLAQHQLSIAFTTYESNQLFTLGLKSDGALAATRRTFERAMGLAATPDRLYLSSKDQIWQLDNVLESGEQYNNHDKLYLPRLAYTTGDLDTHDLAIVDSPASIGNLPPLVFAATRFSCLATLDDRHSFSPVWHPPFISKLAPEDRCHLNGIAVVEGQPRYVTTISQSDVADGWRDYRATGGCLIDVTSGEIVVAGLSMPHSPRWYDGKLWLLNSGMGELGYVDLTQGVFVPVTFCPGYLRGLAFWKDHAIVGLSRARDDTFTGLPLDEQLARRHAKPRCGLLVINLHSGDIVHWVDLAGDINELYDVQVLPGVRSPTIAQRQRQVFASDLHTKERRSWFAAPKPISNP